MMPVTPLRLCFGTEVNGDDVEKLINKVLTQIEDNDTSAIADMKSFFRINRNGNVAFQLDTIHQTFYISQVASAIDSVLLHDSNCFYAGGDPKMEFVSALFTRIMKRVRYKNAADAFKAANKHLIVERLQNELRLLKREKQELNIRIQRIKNKLDVLVDI